MLSSAAVAPEATTTSEGGLKNEENVLEMKKVEATPQNISEMNNPESESEATPSAFQVDAPASSEPIMETTGDLNSGEELKQSTEENSEIVKSAELEEVAEVPTKVETAVDDVISEEEPTQSEASDKTTIPMKLVEPSEGQNGGDISDSKIAETLDEVNQGNAPFHLLMLPASEHPKSPLVEPTLPANRRLRRDYLSRRYRAYHSTSKTTQTQRKGDQSAESQARPRFTFDETRAVPIWSGATALEQALVDCCELSPTQEDEGVGEDTDSQSTPKGGALARGYEVRFTGIVAKFCHTFESRVLALTILERTLERDKEDILEFEQEDNEVQSTSSVGKLSADAEEDEEGEDEEDEADDDDWDPDDEGAKPRTRKSKRIRAEQKRGRGRPPKRTKTKPNEDTSTLSPSRANSPKKAEATPKALPPKNGEEHQEEENGKKEEKPTERMAVFLSAGGLKILKSWLMDAATPVQLPNLKPTPGEPAALNKAPQVKKYKPSKYGPLLLPLLILLKDIPFDKNLVVESKINKQIRKLSKQVNNLVDAFTKQDKGNQGDEALETYVDPGAGAGGLVVVQVQEALNMLKETWEEHAKSIPINPQEGIAAVKDPYDDMKLKLRERLDALKAVEAGQAQKPQWLKNYEMVQKDRVKKRRKLPIKPKKTSTEQLALKEREAERVALKDKLKAAEEERKAHLQRLKNQISKRISESRSYSAVNPSSVKPKKKTTKSVKWKDGLSSDKIRKRDVLEQVFIMEQSAESAPDRSKTKKEEKKAKEEPVVEEILQQNNDELGPEISPQNNDQHGLFEFDETLLL